MSAVPGETWKLHSHAAKRPAAAQEVEPSSLKSSYLDVEVTQGGLIVFERQGDGNTAVLVEALKRYGLRLSPRVSSPCG